MKKIIIVLLLSLSFITNVKADLAPPVLDDVKYDANSYALKIYLDGENNNVMTIIDSIKTNQKVKTINYNVTSNSSEIIVYVNNSEDFESVSQYIIDIDGVSHTEYVSTKNNTTDITNTNDTNCIDSSLSKEDIDRMQTTIYILYITEIILILLTIIIVVILFKKNKKEK